MKHFTIDKDNNITLHASRKAARETGAAVFSTEEQFADTIGNDNQRLLEIFNSLPGVKPVTKFANRKTATERIWRAIQNLGGPVAPAQEPEAPVEIAAAEPIAQIEPAPESVAPPAISEPLVPAAEPQSEPAADSQEQEPIVVPTEAAQPVTPFDEPVATVSAQGADVATTEAPATKKATRAKKTPTGETGAPARGQQDQSRYRDAQTRRRHDAGRDRGRDGLAETHHASHVERWRVAYEEARTDRNQRESW